MNWVRLASLVVVVTIGCGASVRREEPLVECASDLDCAEGKKCVARSPGASGAAAPRDPGRDLATGGTGVCPVTSCGTGCPAGQVCRAGAMPSCPMYTSCQYACTDPEALPCGPGTLCRSSGRCEPIRCDDSDYPGCPAAMVCDPTVLPETGIPGGYTIFGTEQYPYAYDGHGPILTDEQRAAGAALCVFLKCNEPGGLACGETFRCDVENASPLTSGCIGIPCRELGRCSSDAYICEPTSAGRRSDLVDAYGCVEKNCEEGQPCPAGYRCDPSSFNGDVYGCVSPLAPDPGGGGASGTAGTGGTSGTAGTGGTSGAGGTTADTGVCQ